MMRTVKILWFTLLIWLTPTALLAQKAEERAAAETPAGETDTEAEPTADEGAPESSEVFIPTEEISEDFAVSFPVDI
jgi:hypothetical protein